MRAGLGHIWKKIKTAVRRSLASHWQAKLITLLVSVFLWFLIKLSKDDYRHTLYFPVAFIQAPANLRLTKPPISEVKLIVQGQGFALLKHAWSARKKVEINLSALQHDSEGRYYWLASRRKDALQEQFDHVLTIVATEPDTIFVEFTRVQSRKLPVQLSVQVQSPRFTHMSHQQLLQPDSVLVEAPPDILDTLKAIRAQGFVMPEFRDSVHITKTLISPHPAVQLSHEQVLATLFFEPLTEGAFSIPIKVAQLHPDWTCEVYPREAEVSFQVPLSQYSRILPDAFTVAVDFREARKDDDRQYLTVQIVEQPAQVRQVNIQPKRVEYIITKKP